MGCEEKGAGALAEEYGREKFRDRPGIRRRLKDEDALLRAARNAIYAQKKGSPPDRFSDRELLMGREEFKKLLEPDKPGPAEPEPRETGPRIRPDAKYRAHVAKGRRKIRRKF